MDLKKSYPDPPTKKKERSFRFKVLGFFIQTKLSHNGQPVIITNSNVCLIVIPVQKSKEKRKHERK